ncbi:MAG TPA: undecaprenyl-diphosphate phosphatase [Chthoniobacterales bacterium]|jgi:undecaprenyl-diphosphatase
MDLPHWLVVVILGIIEGITEFIPVSSTGHLLIAEHFLPRQSELFNVLIQCGAVAAVLPLFRERLAMLSRFREPKSRDLLAKILVSFALTGVVGYILKKAGLSLPETVMPVALALIIGGILFIFVEKWLKGRLTTAEISWATALLVAAAQLVAIVFPGASRSGSTILIALILGTTRVAATEFSFLVGIPTLLAAGAYSTYKELKGGTEEDWSMLALGSAVAAVVSFVVVKWLLRYVQSHTFVGFGAYRIVLGVVLILLMTMHFI